MLLLLPLLAIAPASPRPAAAQAPAPAGVAADPAAVVRDTGRAWELAAKARARGDAAGLIEAIRMAMTATRQGGARDLPSVLELRALLREARALAGKDTGLNRQIDDLEEVANARSRGITGRSVINVRGAVLKAGRVWSGAFPAKGGAPFTLRVLTSGHERLEMKVTDEAGHRICLVSGSMANMPCDFTPARTGVFMLRMHNLSAVSANFDVISN